ncbi:EF-hand domain-containing protein [Streptomyces sp. BA2]|uniref:EF-hand domain-containing protein n=1 Tax=Streptomyces sp. BA2 TaxID=436595 RepID=UPI00132810B5|nr:EF-hand domain-containing protein [Streptomyces sp. BA2]
MDGDELVDRQDTVRRAEQLIAGLHEPAESHRARAVLRGAQTFWEGMAKLAGIREDGLMTETAFVDALEQAVETGVITELVGPAVEAHVALVDRNGDGVVSLEEFIVAQQVFGQGGQIARDAFAAMDRDGDGRVTVDEWQETVLEFYTSTDPGAPGNLVLGLRG